MLDGFGGSGMKIALQFSRSCARGRVPEVLTIAIIIYIIGVASTHASPATTTFHGTGTIRGIVLQGWITSEDCQTCG